MKTIETFQFIYNNIITGVIYKLFTAGRSISDLLCIKISKLVVPPLRKDIKYILLSFLVTCYAWGGVGT